MLVFSLSVFSSCLLLSSLISSLALSKILCSVLLVSSFLLSVSYLCLFSHVFSVASFSPFPVILLFFSESLHFCLFSLLLIFVLNGFDYFLKSSWTQCMLGVDASLLN